MTISLIVAKDLNGVIGKDNKLPWKLPYDLAFFKMMTEGKTVLMGRKCFESIGKALPNRTNIILTHNVNFRANDACICSSPQAVIDKYKNSSDQLLIIGGGEIYNIFLPYADSLYITQLFHEFEGDTYFPEIDYDEWTVKWNAEGVTNEKNNYTYYFTKYEKKLDK